MLAELKFRTPQEMSRLVDVKRSLLNPTNARTSALFRY